MTNQYMNQLQTGKAMENNQKYPMSFASNAKTQLLFVWCGPAAMVMWLVGFLGFAGFVPPLSPSASAQEIQRFYQANATMIRVGLCFTIMGATLIGPFVAALSVQLKRIEGFHSPAANAQLGLGVLVILLFTVPCFMLGTAAFRPERDAELILLLNDASWIPFVGGFQTTFIQLLTITACILAHPEQKILPRWVGFYCFWTALLCAGGALILFFRKGPFAWDGLIGFWLVVVVYCSWFLVMFWVLRKAILNQALESGE